MRGKAVKVSRSEEVWHYGVGGAVCLDEKGCVVEGRSVSNVPVCPVCRGFCPRVW